MQSRPRLAIGWSRNYTRPMETPYRRASVESSVARPESIAEKLILLAICIVLLVGVFRVIGAHDELWSARQARPVTTSTSR
jgi:hypothetical protein